MDRKDGVGMPARLLACASSSSFITLAPSPPAALATQRTHHAPIQLIIARDIAKAPELTNLLKQCAKTVMGAGKCVGVGGCAMSMELSRGAGFLRDQTRGHTPNPYIG